MKEKRSITEADRRRWILPDTVWQEREVPFDTDPDWPEALQEALTDYRKAWRAKMDEVNDCIAKSSEGEELVDQPEVDRKRIRVSGPLHNRSRANPPRNHWMPSHPSVVNPMSLWTLMRQRQTETTQSMPKLTFEDMIRLLRNDSVRISQQPNTKIRHT